MSVRKRTWLNADSSRGEAWVVDYVDLEGKRHLRHFDTKPEAASYHTGVGVARAGICRRCGFWMPDDAAKLGLCRRHAPVVGPGDDAGIWPVTSATSWCGDFELGPKVGGKR